MPYIGQLASGNSKIIKHVFTATASQTAFSVASNAGDELQVFLNGVLLKETDDYTYTTSTVTLGAGATVSDILEVHVYQSFAVANAVRETGDTMSGELEVPTVKLSSNIIKASDGGSTITLDTSDNVTIAGNVKVGGNIIQASDGGNTLTLDTSDNLTVAGNVKVGGNIIQASDGGNTLTLDTSDNLTVAGNIQVGGNVIKASDGGSTITLDTSDNVTIAGGLTVTGGITNAGTISAGSIGSSVTGFTGFKVVDVYYLNSSLAGSQDPIEAGNYTRATASNGGANFGTGMTLNGTGSNDGIFTFPQTGIWRVEAIFSLQSNSNSSSRYVFGKIRMGTAGTSGSSPTVANARANLPAGHHGDTTYAMCKASVVLDVTTSGTSGTIVKFGYAPQGTPSLLASNSGELHSFFVFYRLGDT